MKAIIAILILAGGGFAFYNYAMPTNQDWVHGKWKYFDQGGKEIDYMVFHPNGVVDLENEKGKYFTCVYVTWGETLKMECEVKGKKKELVYDVSGDKRTLSNSAKSATYKKIGA